MDDSRRNEDSPTLWVEQLRQGDSAAGQKLWQRYYENLVHLARRRLQFSTIRSADEEDVALSAFHSFFRGVERGRFPQLGDRCDLWRVLVTLTLNKVAHLRRDQGRQKRGGGWKLVPLSDAECVESLTVHEPSPAMAAELIERFQQLMGRLADPMLRRIAVAKLEGYTNAEIAENLDVAERTVERKLTLIRATWLESSGEQPHDDE